MAVNKNSQKYQEFERHLIKVIYLHVLIQADHIKIHLDRNSVSMAFHILSTLTTFVFQSELAYRNDFSKVDWFLTELRALITQYLTAVNEGSNMANPAHYRLFRAQVITLFNSNYSIEDA
jgi:hypothetical protein